MRIRKLWWIVYHDNIGPKILHRGPYMIGYHNVIRHEMRKHDFWLKDKDLYENIFEYAEEENPEFIHPFKLSVSGLRY